MTRRAGCIGAIFGLLVVFAPIAVGPSLPRVREWRLAVGPGAIKAPARFGLVGVSWPTSSREPDGVQVRTSRDGTAWTPWTELDLQPLEGPDPSRERHRLGGTAPLWVKDASLVRVRFKGLAPKGARLVVVDPGRDARTALPEALAAPSRPNVITRAQWGADESMRRATAATASSLKMVFVHHTATGNDYGPDDSAAIVRAIYAFHVQGRGWDDIGYNLLIDRFGQVFEGRAGGIDRALIGAHTLGFNTGSSGISLIGTFSDGPPTEEAMRALRETLAWKLDLHNIDPTGTTSMVSQGGDNYPKDAVVSLPRIAGHRDVGNTDCPGQWLYDALPAIRSEVFGIGDPKVFEPGAARLPFTPNGDGVADTTTATARFSSRSSWRADVLDGSGNVIRSLGGGTGQSATATWDGKTDAGATAVHGIYRIRFVAENTRGTSTPGLAEVHLWAWPNGTMLHAPNSHYVYVLDNNRLRHVNGPAAMRSRYRIEQAIRVPDQIAEVYPSGDDVGFRDGSIVRAEGQLYMISGGQRRPMSPETLAALGYSPDVVVDVDSSELRPHPVGQAVAPGSHPSGAVLRGDTLPVTWKLAEGGRPVASEAIRTSYGIRPVDVVGPADAEIAASTPLNPLGFADGTLFRASSSPRVYVVENGQRRWISSQFQFDMMGYRGENIVVASDADAQLNPDGPAL